MILLRRRQRSTSRLVAVSASVLGAGGGVPTGPAPAENRTAPGVEGLGGTDTGRLARDQTWFLAIFVVKVGLGLVAFAIKPWLRRLFFAAYAAYFWREMRDGGEAASAEDLEPLKLRPAGPPPARWRWSLRPSPRWW